MEKFKRSAWQLIAFGGALVIGRLIVLGVATSVASTPAVQPQAARNSYVNGCVGGGGTTAICGCAYDKLLVLYPDFNTNPDRTRRIIQDGYNQAEIQAVMPCLNAQTT